MPDPTQRVPLRERLDRARRFVKKGVWEVEPSGLSRVRGALIYYVRMGILIAEGSLRNHLLLRAAALTYKTVFSIVPLMAVMLAFFKGFGGTERLGHSLQSGTLSKLTPGLREVMERLNDSITNIHTGAVGGIGLLVLLYSAISLLTTIEKSFNDIWGLKKGRTFIWRCIIYWGVLTLLPVVVTLSIAATGLMQTSTQWLRDHLPLADEAVLFMTPFVFAWFGFAALYYFMPNIHVRWRSALVGGIIGGTLWEAAKHGYVYYNHHVTAAYRVYGTLAAVPMFLLWIYLSWILILFGAECAFAHQNVRTYRREIDTASVCAAVKEELALLAMILVSREFLAGSEPVTVRRIGEAINVPVRLVHDILFQLGAAGLVREVAGAEAGYVPGRDPAAISVKAVLDAVRHAGAAPAIGRHDEDDAVRELLARAEAAQEKELGGVTVGELVKRS